MKVFFGGHILPSLSMECQGLSRVELINSVCFHPDGWHCTVGQSGGVPASTTILFSGVAERGCYFCTIFVLFLCYFLLFSAILGIWIFLVRLKGGVIFVLFSAILGSSATPFSLSCDLCFAVILLVCRATLFCTNSLLLRSKVLLRHYLSVALCVRRSCE